MDAEPGGLQSMRLQRARLVWQRKQQQQGMLI